MTASLRACVVLLVVMAACLLFLTVLAEHAMISHARASIMARGIAHDISHLQRQAWFSDYWKRQHGPARIHQCKGFKNATTRFAAVSLLTLDDSDMYSTAAVKLATSLRWWFPAEKLDLVLMIADDFGVSSSPDFNARARRLELSGWNILCMVPVIQHPNPPVRNRFHDMRAYTRLNVWGLTEYDAVLSLDLDTLVIRDPSILFTHHMQEMRAANKTIAAVPDRPAAMSATFNAGVLFLIPSEAVLHSLLAGLATVPHDTNYAEQGYLNARFNASKVFKLQFIFNANVVSKRDEPDLWHKNRDSLTIIHFTVSKPWHSFRHMSLHYPPSLCWELNTDDLCQLWDMVPVL